MRLKKPAVKMIAGILAASLFLIMQSCNSGNPIGNDSYNAVEGTVTDIEGNVYKTVRIGNQIWTAENLRTTKYSDGSPIPIETIDTLWADTAPEYCFYNNTTNGDSIKKYGALYNWYVVDPTNPKKIAPKGWHVSTDADWRTLQEYLISNRYNWDSTTTGNKIAVSMSVKSDWYIDSTTGAVGSDMAMYNSSGFSAIPAGGRRSSGEFDNKGMCGVWWCSTECEEYSAWIRYVFYGDTYLHCEDQGKKDGLSVRLVKDTQ